MAIHFGYIITGPLTGLFVVKSGQPKTTIIFGFIISSLATFYTPMAATNLFSMMWARAMTGAGLGMVIVSMYHFIAFWIPRQEVSEKKKRYFKKISIVFTKKIAYTFLYCLVYKSNYFYNKWILWRNDVF